MAMKYFDRAWNSASNKNVTIHTTPDDNKDIGQTSPSNNATENRETQRNDSSKTLQDSTSPCDDKESSILSEDDEVFLHKIASDVDLTLPSPAQDGVSDKDIPSSAFLTPLPSSPPEESEIDFVQNKSEDSKKSWSYKTYVPFKSFALYRKPTNVENIDMVSNKNQEEARESRDMSTIMGSLNLSTINNRVVSLSDDSRNLIQQFNQILRDIVSGVPTAYDDLEKFLTNRQSQIENLYKSMPPFIQALIMGLPAKMMSASNSRGKEVKTSTTGTKPSKGKQVHSYTPTLRNLIAQKGAVAGMLQSTITFLETRFPALLVGTNVLMSLTVFILMFVFWYCHKRGREKRLANEEADVSSDKDTEHSSMHGPEIQTTDKAQQSDTPAETSTKDCRE